MVVSQVAGGMQSPLREISARIVHRPEAPASGHDFVEPFLRHPDAYTPPSRYTVTHTVAGVGFAVKRTSVAARFGPAAGFSGRAVIAVLHAASADGGPWPSKTPAGSGGCAAAMPAAAIQAIANARAASTMVPPVIAQISTAAPPWKSAEGLGTSGPPYDAGSTKPWAAGLFSARSSASRARACSWRKYA